MAYKIVDHRFVDHRIEAQGRLSAEDLRRKFESAVCELHPADFAAKKRQPIVPRRKVLGISQAYAEKRAVTEAAQALAVLWKL
jgi:hypothetical protein